MNSGYKTGIAVLGGGLINDHGIWRMTRFLEIGDRSGVNGDYVRAVAASHLCKVTPNSVIIASGGKGYQTIDGAQPLLCDVITQELIKLGINEDNIIKEEKSNSTFEQLKEIANISNDLALQKIIIISNRFHVPRVKKILEHFDTHINFSKKSSVEIIEAEQIAINYDPKQWRPVVERAYKSSEMTAIIQKEQQGLKDIEDGKYIIRNLNAHE